MELTLQWLERLAGEAGRRLGETLRALPGRSAHGEGSGHQVEAAEFSEREGEQGLRLAWNVDSERVAPGSVAAFLDARGVAIPDLGPTLAQHPGAHVQVGVDGERTKLYAYRRPLPGLMSDLVTLAAGKSRDDAAFACVDLDATPTLKQYAEFPTVGSLQSSGRLLAEPALEAVLRSLPAGLSSGPAPLVLTELQVCGVIVGHTLHVAVDAAPEHLAELAGAALADRLALHLRAAHRLGLRLRPTYVSWSRRHTPEPIRTAYYRLEPRRP